MNPNGNVRKQDTQQVRKPDTPFQEQLLPYVDDNFDNIEQQLEMALQESILEYQKHQEELMKEREKRKHIFGDFMFQICKIGKYDREIQNIHDMLEPLVTAYTNFNSNSFVFLDALAYDHVFDTLKQIRVGKDPKYKDAMDTLQHFIKKT